MVPCWLITHPFRFSIFEAESPLHGADEANGVGEKPTLSSDSPEPKEQKYLDASQFRFLTEEEIQKRYSDAQSDLGDFATHSDGG